MTFAVQGYPQSGFGVELGGGPTPVALVATVHSQSVISVVPTITPGGSCPLPDTFSGSSLGPCWTSPAVSDASGTPSVGSGVASGSGVSAYWLTAFDAGTQTVTIIIPSAPPNYNGVAAMLVDGSQNGYSLYWQPEPSGGQFFLEEYTGGTTSATIDTGFTGSYSYPLTITLERTAAGALTGTIGGSVETTATDTTHTPTYAGFQLWGGTITEFDADPVSSGGGSSVALVASAYSLGITLASAPVARSLRAGAVALGLAATGAAIARQLRASDVSRSAVAAPLPVGRGLSARAISRSGTGGAGAFGRALVASVVSASPARSLSIRSLGLRAVALGRSLAGSAHAIARAMVAQSVSRSSGSDALPVSRSMSARILGQYQTSAPLPVARSLRASAFDFDLVALSGLDVSGVLEVLLTATALSVSRETAYAPIVRALAANTVGGSSATAADRVARALRASSVSLARAGATSRASRGLAASALSSSADRGATRSDRTLRAATTSSDLVRIGLSVTRLLEARALSRAETVATSPVLRGLRAATIGGGRARTALPTLRGLSASAIAQALAAAWAPVERDLAAHGLSATITRLGDLIVLAGNGWIVPIARVTLIGPTATVDHDEPLATIAREALPTLTLTHTGPGATVDHDEPSAIIAHMDPGATLDIISPAATVDHDEPRGNVRRRTA